MATRSDAPPTTRSDAPPTTRSDAPSTAGPIPPSTAARPSRRIFLATTLGAAGAAGLDGGAFAQGVAPTPPVVDYVPVWFGVAEWAFIVAATTRLIPPEGDGPSAIEAGVPIFIDLQLNGDFGAATDWYMEGPHDPAASPLLGYQLAQTPAALYRQMIPAIDDACRKAHGQPFAGLDAATQDAVLGQLEKGELLPGPLTREFFAMLLQNTREGYLSDPKYGGNRGMGGWLLIGFPGARAAYLEWADMTDKPYPLGPVSIDGERA